MFCGRVVLREDKQIKDITILTSIGGYIEENCQWEQIQEVSINHWKRDVNNAQVLLMEATYYESYVRYPTDVKLMWESCQWVFDKQLYHLWKIAGASYFSIIPFFFKYFISISGAADCWSGRNFKFWII